MYGRLFRWRGSSRHCRFGHVISNLICRLSHEVRCSDSAIPNFRNPFTLDVSEG